MKVFLELSNVFPVQSLKAHSQPYKYEVYCNSTELCVQEEVSINVNVETRPPLSAWYARPHCRASLKPLRRCSWPSFRLRGAIRTA
jgi:hypothetical protein